jgi:hypothetical protein
MLAMTRYMLRRQWSKCPVDTPWVKLASNNIKDAVGMVPYQ